MSNKKNIKQKPKLLALSCIMLKNGNTYFVKYTNTCKYTKYVWPFFDIMHERVKTLVCCNIIILTLNNSEFLYLLKKFNRIYVINSGDHSFNT